MNAEKPAIDAGRLASPSPPERNPEPEQTKPRFRLIDPKFRHNVGPYLFQCGLASAYFVIVLLFLDVISHTAIIATLGASSFIVFTMPRQYSSRPRPLLGGYFVGMTVGCLCSLLSQAPVLTPMLTPRTSSIVFGALAVGVAILLMTITNTEHPPATGMALGLVLNEWDYGTIIFIVLAILFMAAIRQVLKPRLINLV